MKWVLEDAKFFGLEFDSSYINYFRPYLQDALVDSKTPIYQVFDMIRMKGGNRIIKCSNKELPDIHYSIVKRTCATPESDHPRRIAL